MAFFLMLLLFSASFASAGSLDDYYLSRFGEGEKTVQKESAGIQQDTALFEKCSMPLYKGLRSDWGKLQGSTQKVLGKYLARPSLSAEAQVRSAGGHFTIHYATTGSDAPPLDETNGNGIPDWVEKVAAVFEAVYQREVVEMGYKQPPTNNGQPYDVYLQNLGGMPARYLGLTDHDGISSGNSYFSYMTIDNDFSEFDTKHTPEEYLKTTAAHEFLHAIQFGYNYWFEIWYAEASSTWIEDEVFDSINQVYDYLPAYLQNLRLPLNADTNVTTGGGYGRWIFNRYLAETAGKDFLRSFWEKLAIMEPSNATDIPALPLLNTLLNNRLDEHVLGLGRRFVVRDWTTHLNEIRLIHPAIPTSLSSLITYPDSPYSFALYEYTVSPDLSGKPSAVAYLDRADLGSNILLLSNNQTGTRLLPPDLSPAPATYADALVKADLPTLVAGPAVDPKQPVNPGATSESSKGCFIATAAYGSYLHPKVKLLRDFRDRYLLTHRAGRLFVQLYYRFSPPVADFIRSHDTIRMICRWTLSPLVYGLEFPLRTLLFFGTLSLLLIKGSKRVSPRCGQKHSH